VRRPGAPFTAVQNCQGAELAPGESCEVFYRFAPTDPGPASATSSFSINGVPFTVELSGTGVGLKFLVTPTALEFGEVQVGDTSPQQITTVTNTGSAPVMVSMAGGAPGAPFTAVQNCQGAELAPGESCEVFYRFAPTDPGPASATSSFSINGVPFTVELTGTGVTQVLVVEIDIKPGGEPNCVNPNSKGRTPIAVLATDEFDPSDIDGASIAVDGVTPVHDAPDDVNGDGLVDRVLGFDTQDLADAGLLTDGNELTLTGMLTDGTPVEGSDLVFLAPGPHC
jgi:hypothetical protein